MNRAAVTLPGLATGPWPGRLLVWNVLSTTDRIALNGPPQTGAVHNKLKGQRGFYGLFKTNHPA